MSFDPGAFAPTIFDWPANLCPADVTVRPPRATVGSSTSLSGATQAVPAIRPPFGLTLEFGTLIGDKILSYRALLASLEGQANRVRVPLFDLWYRAKDSAIGVGSVPHSDGTSFSDGALYLTDDLSGVTVTGVQGQRTITADFGAYGRLLSAGLYFGLGDCPYVVQRMSWDGSVATIRHSPTLRFDCDAAELRLKPVMIAKLVDDDNGELRLRRGRYGGPTLDLVEAFDAVAG
jgi:hypothetical protein